MSEQETGSWDDFVSGAKKEAEGFESRGKKDDEEYTPMVFLQEGTHKIRLYTDKSNPGKVRLIRRVFFHRAEVPVAVKAGETPKTRKVRVRCEGEGSCKICSVMEEAKKLGYARVWTHWNSTGLAYAVVYESTEKSDYMKLGVPVVVALEYKMIYAINKLMSGYTGAEIKTIMDTLEESNMIEITHKGGQGGNTMAGFDLRRKPLPPLPSYFKPLEDLYVPDKPGSDEDVKAICQAIMEKVTKVQEFVQPDGSQSVTTAGGTTTTTPAPEPTSGVTTPPVTNAGPVSSNAGTYTPPVGAVICIPGVVANLPADVKVPANAPPCYGARPEAGHPICTACYQEPLCLQTSIAMSLAAKR